MDFNVVNRDFSMAMELLAFVPCEPRHVTLSDLALDLFDEASYDNIKEVRRLIEWLSERRIKVLLVKSIRSDGRRGNQRAATIAQAHCADAQRKSEMYLDRVWQL